MALQYGTATACGLTREVTWDPETGHSTRQSVSAGTHVDNGYHESLEDAIAEAEADIERGKRDYGDDSYRGD
jgi:hypothetical protein